MTPDEHDNPVWDPAAYIRLAGISARELAEALSAARAWAAAHGHAQPDDRMLAEYGKKITEAAHRAGYRAGRAGRGRGGKA